jgi:uncharacterized repeat protein (TIGR03803 family)
MSFSDRNSRKLTTPCNFPFGHPANGRKAAHTSPRKLEGLLTPIMQTQIMRAPAKLASGVSLSSRAYSTPFRTAYHLALLSLLILLCCSPAQATTFEEIFGFARDAANPTDSLIQAANGDFYGTTIAGGTASLGTVFKLTSTGQLVTLVSFTGTNGSYPRGTLAMDDAGNLFGTTYAGGNFNQGTIFELTTSGQLITLYHFGNGPAANPYGGLVRGTNGDFYGTTETYSSVFQISTNGTFTNLTSFFGLRGFSLDGSLFPSSDGTFYGMAGVKAFSQTGGMYFRLYPDGSLDSLFQFGGTNTHGLYSDRPYGGLSLGANGKLYGTSTSGGMSNLGTIYSLTKDGTFTQICDFTGTNGFGLLGTAGAFPFSAPTLGSDGNLYGSTVAGGQFDQGTIYRIDGSDTVSTLFSFSGTNGSQPYGRLLLASDGKLYGTTRSGGTYNSGTVFSLSTNGVLTTLVSFPAATAIQTSPYLLPTTNGEVFGATANLTNGIETLFHIGSDGSLVTIATFSSTSNGIHGPLTFASDGYFYGASPDGGPNNAGTIFKLSASGSIYLLFSFSITNGANPSGGLILGTDGYFYGTTLDGGISNRGTVFRSTTSGVVTTLACFSGTNGANPIAGLLQGLDGAFYGTTRSGGDSNCGTIFKITTNGDLTTLASFSRTNGSMPFASLIQDQEGNLYGTTTSGGNTDRDHLLGSGTIFKLTTNNTLITLFAFSGTNGSAPYASLFLGVDGSLYGTTAWGGPDGAGTVFKLAPTGELITIHSFSSATGGNPTSGLVQGSDGYLYGTAAASGSSKPFIFRIYESPVLHLNLLGSQAQLTWPSSASDFQLEYSSDLSSSMANWIAVPTAPVTNGLQVVVPESVSTTKFYRLRKP